MHGVTMKFQPSYDVLKDDDVPRNNTGYTKLKQYA